MSGFVRITVGTLGKTESRLALLSIGRNDRNAQGLLSSYPDALPFNP